jgi:hypothetical protein
VCVRKWKAREHQQRRMLAHEASALMARNCRRLVKVCEGVWDDGHKLLAAREGVLGIGLV